jgi:hypothetical protein
MNCRNETTPPPSAKHRKRGGVEERRTVTGVLAPSRISSLVSLRPYALCVDVKSNSSAATCICRCVAACIRFALQCHRTSFGGHFLIHNRFRCNSGSKLCTSSTNAARPKIFCVDVTSNRERNKKKKKMKIENYQAVDRERMTQMANRPKSVRKSLCLTMRQETQTFVRAI